MGSIPTEVKDFFFTSCGSLIPFTRANAQWVIHGFDSSKANPLRDRLDEGEDSHSLVECDLLSIGFNTARQVLKFSFS